MIIQTKNLRGINKFLIDRCVDDESTQQRKGAVVFDSQVSLYLVACRLYRTQVVAEFVNMLNFNVKHFQMRSNFYISDYSLQPTQIIKNQLIQ